MDTFASKAADMLAYKVILLVRANLMDARSPVADAAMDYIEIRFPGSDSVEDFVKYVEQKSDGSEIKEQSEPPSSDEINAMCET